MGSSAPVSRITHYRGRSDTGAVDAAPTFIAAEDTSFGVTPGTNFRIRIGVENTGTATDTITQPDTTRGIVRCGYAALAYTSLTSVINGADAGSDADATNVVTQRLTNGTGTFETGVAGYDENETLSTTSTNGRFTEVEFGTVLTGGASTAGVGGGETWTFQVGGLTNASLNVPTFTTANTNGSDFQHGNQLGGFAQRTSAATISFTTAATASAGNLVVVSIAIDNIQTTDGDESAIASVTVNGESCTKAIEFCNGQGGAALGATVSVWYVQLVGNAAAGATITGNINTGASRVAANIHAKEFVVASGKTVSVEATNSVATDAAAASPTSLDATTSNIECLRICSTAVEADANGVAQNQKASNGTWSFFQTDAHLSWSSAGASVGAMGVITEGNISTGTGAASQIVTTLAAVDWATAYAAFKATAVSTDVIMGQSTL